MIMIKTGLFFNGKLSALTGASTVLRNIIEGFRNSKEIDLYAFMLDANGKVEIKEHTNYSENNSKNVNKFKSNLKIKVHQIFRKYAKTNLLIAKIYVWLTDVRHVKYVIDKYGRKISDMNVLFFHELSTPYRLREAYPEEWNKKKKVIVLHSNGEPLKMFFDYFPIIKKNKKQYKYYMQKVEIVLKDMDKIVFLSTLAQTSFIKMYPQFKEKAIVVPNGLRIQKIEKQKIKKSKEIIFTIVGTVCERKGHDIIVDAVSQLNDEQKSLFKIIVVGDGSITNALKEKCKKENIKNIDFIGASTNVSKYLVQSDVFLLPSRDEGLPMAIIEAMSMKLPILSTNVGGIPDLIEDKNTGWLIDPDIKQLKATISDIIEEKYNIEEMGKKSFEIYSNNFSLQNMIDNYTNIFTKL